MDGVSHDPDAPGTAAPGHPPRVAALAALVAGAGDADGGGHDLVLSDVWGVVHNGVRAHRPAVAALRAAREAGAAVVLITNSPRPREGVVQQLASLGVPREAFDAVVTSGDVTRALMRAGPRRAFHLGPERDLPLFEGTGVARVDETEAEAVVCTGLFDDESETPADYAAMLSRFKDRDLPMIVANPDIVVERGERLIWCAGALARDYRAIGGETRVAGKPHAPIYEEAIRLGGEALGRAPRAALAIGDGLPTDVRGALDHGLPLLFVAGGIHQGKYGGPDADPEALGRFLAGNGAATGVVGWMPRLA